MADLGMHILIFFISLIRLVELQLYKTSCYLYRKTISCACIFVSLNQLVKLNYIPASRNEEFNK